MYQIRLSRQAEKAYRSLFRHDRSLFDRIKSGIENIQKNPFDGKPLVGELKGKFSYRVGSYRIVYQIVREKLLVFVLDMGHRREIYR